MHQDCPADFYAPVPSQTTSFVWLRTALDPAAPLPSDPYLHPGGPTATIRANDWGDQAATGEQFVVAGRRGDWTAIWFAGRKAWFYNPPGIHRAADGWVVQQVRNLMMGLGGTRRLAAVPDLGSRFAYRSPNFT